MSDSKEVEEAKRVLRAAYYEGVDDEKRDLVRRVIDGEIASEDHLQDAIYEAADSAMTYTADQYLTIFASENSEAGREEARELADGGEPALTTWGYTTYAMDLRESLEMNRALLDSAFEAAHQGSDNILVWLAETHGTLLLDEKNEDGTRHYYVGVLQPGTRAEIDLGLVTLSDELPGPTERRTVPEKFDEMVGEHRDPGMMRVLRDALQESGFFHNKGRDPQPAPAPKPQAPSLAKRDLERRGYHVLRGTTERIFAAVPEEVLEAEGDVERVAGLVLDLNNTPGPDGDPVPSWEAALEADWLEEDAVEPAMLGTRVGLVRIDGRDLSVYEYDL